MEHQESINNDPYLLMLFLMVICHQSYRDLQCMPVPVGLHLVSTFNAAVNELIHPTVGGGKPNVLIPNLPALKELMKKHG